MLVVPIDALPDFCVEVSWRFATRGLRLPESSGPVFDVPLELADEMIVSWTGEASLLGQPFPCTPGNKKKVLESSVATDAEGNRPPAYSSIFELIQRKLDDDFPARIGFRRR